MKPISTALSDCRTILFALAAASVTGCAVMPRTKSIGQITPNDKPGIVYSLPRTLATVDVPIKQVARRPGDLLPAQPEWLPFAEYLRKELEIVPQEIILEKFDAYSVDADSSTIGSSAIPDKDATFYVQTEAGGLEELKLDLTFSSRGILTKAEMTSTNQTLPLLGKIGESALSLAGLLAINPATATTTTFKPSDPVVAVVKDIVEIRKLRDATLTKPALDVGVIQLLLESLKTRETKLLARLIGTEETKLWTLHAEVDPASTATSPLIETIVKVHDGAGLEIINAKNKELSSFPSATGPSATAPSRFKKGPPSAAPVIENPTPSTTVLTFELTAKPMLLSYASLPSVSDGSLFYRVPRETTGILKLTSQSVSVIVQQDLLVAQWGVLQQLPRRLGGVSGGYTVTLDESTGALKALATTSKPFDAGAQISALTGKYIEKEKVDEELSALERKKKKLEFEKAIRDLENAAPK